MADKEYLGERGKKKREIFIIGRMGTPSLLFNLKISRTGILVWNAKLEEEDTAQFLSFLSAGKHSPRMTFPHSYEAGRAAVT